jgi:hypothetical protein
MAILTLRMGLFWTLSMISVCYLTVLPSWLERGPEFANVASAVSVTLMFVSGLVSKISTEINAFIADQNNLEAQRKIIEREIELNQQIKAFLPKEIYRRFLLLVEKNITPQQAMRELLDTKEARSRLSAQRHQRLYQTNQATTRFYFLFRHSEYPPLH